MHIRHKIMAAAAVVGLACFGIAQAQQNFDNVEIMTQEVADGIYMLVGQGGNIGLSVGSDGALMIDDQFAPLTPKIRAAVDAVSDNDVKWVLNTHYHFDHVGGNAQWAQAGATIIAHDNVRQRLSHPMRHPLTGDEMPAEPEDAWPVLTYPNGMTFHWNGHTVAVHHIPHAHTDGDSFVHFVEANVIHGGDVVNMLSYPIIDRNAGGSFRGYLRGLERIIATADENTKIIPGHGPLSARSDLESQLQMLRTIQTAVATAKTAGRSLQEVQAMKPSAAYDARWGGGFVSGDAIVAVIYNEAP